MKQSLQTPKASSPLGRTTLEIYINDLVAEHVVRHHFENTSQQSIEAIFTFPIPLDAAFLGMQATLAGETLTAQIQAKHHTSRVYDDALAQGNSAVLITSSEPGVICTSLGNLLPNESCEVELRFVTLLRIADHTARFSLPLVHRPRYGNWCLDDLETPAHDFAIEHPMSATVRVEGLLANAPVTCVTHAARFTRSGKGMELSINHAMLDRDLVITFELSTDAPTIARLIEDGDSTLGLMSFVLPQSNAVSNPLDLCLVLDCSGSMSGDAIAQSRQATNAIVDVLSERDRIQILRFGSTVVSMFRRPLLATQIVRNAIRELDATINADLGGTEMDKALNLAMKQLGPIEAGRPQSIILVTDGAVQPDDIKNIKSKAAKANIRIFIVAVGSSASVEVLKPMAETTNAVLERAVPAEPIDIITMRQFRRARENGPVKLDINWQNTKVEAINTGVFYPGDAVFAAAYLPKHMATERPIIKAHSFEGKCLIEEWPLYEARIAAPAQRALLGQLRYQECPVKLRELIALQYGLLTAETSAVLVKERTKGEIANDFPMIIQIPQMIAEGMMESKYKRQSIPNMSINACCSISDDEMLSLTLNSPLLKQAKRKMQFTSQHTLSASYTNSSGSYLDIPSFLRSQKHEDNFEKELDSQPIKDDTTKKRNSVSSEQVKEIFQVIFTLLRSALSDQSKAFPELCDVLFQLPVRLYSPAKTVMIESALNLSTVSDSIKLLLALQKLLESPIFTEDEEAMLAVKAEYLSSYANRNIILEKFDSRLDKAIKSLLLKGL